LQYEKSGNLNYMLPIEDFSKVSLDLLIFCNTFFIETWNNNNLLKLAAQNIHNFLPCSSEEQSKIERIKNLEKKELEISLALQDVTSETPSLYTEEFDQLINKLEFESSSNNLHEQLEKALLEADNKKDFFKELESTILQNIVKKEKSTREAARKLNMEESTLRKKTKEKNP